MVDVTLIKTPAEQALAEAYAAARGRLPGDAAVKSLREGAFLEAFLAKGRMRPLLEQIPVKLVLNDKAALWGAAHVAAFGL